MKKLVKKNENRFNSKDDCISTQVSGLKTIEFKNCYFRKVVHTFESFPLTNHFPNSDIGEKSYGQNTETMHRGAKNPAFGTAVGIFLAAARIWAETPCCNKKNLAAAPKRDKQCIESPVNP